jgi:acetate kinase
LFVLHSSFFNEALMKILVANLGSTSFKYRLFDMTDEKVLARGGVERIGSKGARCYVTAGTVTDETTLAAPDHAAAVRLCLKQLTEGRTKFLSSASELAGIGFKAVHAHALTGVHRVDERVLAAMEAFSDVAPAHNPPYVHAIRLLAQELPQIPLVAAFETTFHETIPSQRRLYAVPHEWANKHGIKRWGFHGASHRYVAERMAALLHTKEAKIISCHLGGSSSLCAIENGKSIATSMGMSPQSGLPQNNRVGDFDPFALPVLMRATGKTLEQVLDDLANRSGLEGLSGRRDLRDIEDEAKDGDKSAQLALAVFADAVRHYLGAYMVNLGGVHAIVFTGGIGENSPTMRAAICENLDWFGIALDPKTNACAEGECRIDALGSRVQLWVMATNEELIVARQTKALLEAGK